VWDARATFWMGPDEPPVCSDGMCVNESILRGRWLSTRQACGFVGVPYE
jgi:hypothetical protein